MTKLSLADRAAEPVASPTVTTIVVTVATAAVRAEISRQQDLDRPWQGYQATLKARIAAVDGARRALQDRELGAEYALRQSLIDLASVCELLAGEFDPPKAA